MSWDILAQDLPADAQTIDDIPDDFEPKPIGSRSEIISRIRETVPLADFADPTYGNIDGPGFSIGVILGNAEETLAISFVVRGGGLAVGIVADILHHLNLRALDINAGAIFDTATAQASFEQWQAYRDRVITEGRI